MNMESCVAIEGREGNFVFTKSLHQKYSNRPDALNDMCLAMFAIEYQSVPTSYPHTGESILLKENFGRIKPTKSVCYPTS